MASSVFPFIDAAILPPVETSVLPIFREYAWDYENDTLILKDGEPVIFEGASALKVWIYKALKTPRYTHPAFSWGYGCEISSLIGSTYSAAAKSAEAERYITEALIYNPYILEVSDFEISADSDSVEAKFVVKTVYGEVRVNV